MDLRFVGDLNIALGLLLAVLAAAGAWWMYRREVRRGVSPLLAVSLPALRAGVVLLLILMLTGPVLHHREVIGQLGRVLVFVDGSASMGVTDEQVGVDRKLLTAQDRGWLEEGTLDTALADVADRLASARRIAEQARRDTQSAPELRQAVAAFDEHIQQADTGLRAAEPRPLPGAPTAPGSILREWWTGINSNNVESMIEEGVFDEPPDGHDRIEQFTAPQNWEDHYGQRIRGYVHPPASGRYTFWIASDDSSNLYLSTDESPANAERIAYQRGSTSYGNWPEGESQSQPIALEAGEIYYIEALHEEGSGNDHISVGWELPDGTRQRPIPGEHLSPAHAASNADAPMAFDEMLSRFSQEVVSVSVALASREIADADAAEQARVELLNLGRTAGRYEQALRKAFRAYAREVAESGDRAIQLALTRYDGMSRWQRIESLLLEDRGGLLGELSGKHHVELLALGEDEDEVHRLWDSGDAGSVPETLGAEAVAPYTNLATGVEHRVTALRQGLSGRTANAAGAEGEDDAGGEGEAEAEIVQVADGPGGSAEMPEERTAVVMFSDGRHNRGGSPLQAARLLGNQRVPVFGVGVGAVRPPADLAMLAVSGPDNVFRDDRVQGEIVFSDTMPAGEPFTARVEHEGEVVWEQTLTTQNAGRRRVSFDFGVDELVEQQAAAGDRADIDMHSVPMAMNVTLGPMNGETRDDNNERPLHFSAISSAHRLLIVDGRARWETRYLRNLFERDTRWEVNTVIAGPAAERSSIPRGEGDGAFPADREALFEYDLVIFGELPAGLLDEAELEHLRHFVERRGGGVIFLDGQRQHLADYTDTPIDALLPVNWQFDELNDSAMPDYIDLTDAGRRRSALRLDVELNSRDLWNALPAPHWAANVSVTRGAGEVLAEAVFEDDRRVPLMVERRVGAGRVLYLGSDESWRWRYEVADLYHQRFWNQLASDVMESSYQVSDEFVSIDPGGLVHRPGESEEIRVRLRDEEGRPVLHATAEAVVWQGDRQVATVELDADGNEGGVFRGETPDLEPGDYELSVRVTGVPDDQMRARARFIVQGEHRGELAQLHLHEDLMRQMADASEGAYLREEHAAGIPELLEPLSAGRVVESDTELWQSYWWFAAMIGLLSVEWLVRKRAGML